MLKHTFYIQTGNMNGKETSKKLLTSTFHAGHPTANNISEKLHTPWGSLIDYSVVKVVSTRKSALPSCILQRVMGHVAYRGRRPKVDTGPMTRGRIQ